MDDFIEREWHKKYANTHAALINRTDDNDKHVVYIQGVGDGVFSTSVNTPKGWDKKLFQTNEYKIMAPLKSRLFNWQGRTYRYTHRPERQWQVGVCENNSMIMCLDENMAYVRELLKQDVQIRGTPSVWRNTQASPFVDLFLPNNARSIDGAINYLKDSSDMSKVVRKFWSVMLSNSNEYMLWYYDYLVGLIDSNKRTIKILNPIFKQEISDLLYRTGEFYECI